VTKSDDDGGKKLPVRHCEILPPAKGHNNMPVAFHDPRGVVDSVASGFMSGIRARSIARYNELLRQKLGQIRIGTEIADALLDHYIAWDRIDNIAAILDGRERQWAHDALVLEIKRETEIRELKNAALRVQTETERIIQEQREQRQAMDRANERAASLAEQQRWENKAAEEGARAHYIAKRRDRLLTEAIQELVIETRKELEKVTATEAKAKLSRALRLFENLSRDSSVQVKSTDTDALRALAAKFKHKMKLAEDRHDNAEYGIYALALAAVEEQMMQSKGPSKKGP